MFNQSLTKRGLFFAATMLLPALSVMGATSPYEHRMKGNQNGATNGSQSSSMKGSMLTSEEQQFSSQLSDLHRQIFLNEFSPMQRAEAMALFETDQGRKYRKSMSADMAVEEVLKDQRGKTSSSATQKKMRYKDSSKYSGSSRNKPKYDYETKDKDSDETQGNSYSDDDQDEGDQSSSKRWWQSEQKQQKSSQTKKRRQSGYWD